MPRRNFSCPCRRASPKRCTFAVGIVSLKIMGFVSCVLNLSPRTSYAHDLFLFSSFRLPRHHRMYRVLPLPIGSLWAPDCPVLSFFFFLTLFLWSVIASPAKIHGGSRNGLPPLFY